MQIDDASSLEDMDSSDHENKELIDRQIKELAGILVEYYLSQKERWNKKM